MVYYMIVEELLNDLFTNRHITLTKALEQRFAEYLKTYGITMSVLDYLQWLQQQGKIHVLALPGTNILKLQRIYP